MRAVRRVQDGENPEVVIKALGFHRACIYDWLARYRSGGWEALRSRKSGGRKPRLNGKQIQWIYKTITMGDPRQFKFPYALWTRGIIAKVIREKFGITLSLPSVGRLLAQLGLTCQRPLFRAYQQNPALVEKWLQDEYPKIKALAKKDGAEIYFGDEAGIRSDHHGGSTWAPRGETPVITTTGERFGFNILSAVSARGLLRFMVTPGRVASQQFCQFLDRLMYRAKKPIFLVVDGHPMHRSKQVAKHVESYGRKLQLFILPPYSPELNPDEYVWNDLKSQLGRTESRSREELKANIQGYLEVLQSQPQKIQSFFQAEKTRYAA